MSLFYSHHGCHPGAIVMHKRTGAVYRVRGNVSLYDMSAVLVPNDVSPADEVTEDGTFCEGVRTASGRKLKRDYLILDEGAGPLPRSLLAPTSSAGGK